jgi:hypothetical protein
MLHPRDRVVGDTDMLMYLILHIQMHVLDRLEKNLFPRIKSYENACIYNLSRGCRNLSVLEACKIDPHEHT